MRIGYFLSTEEFTPAELLAQARAAERAGFEALWISDHYHPWNDAQGQSPFVWSMIGALSQACRLPMTTAVTCPTVRIHPAIVAQAAATSAVLCEGRFVLGVGTGEALNEHIFGDPWPTADVRLEMLEEAVEVMRALWRGGFVNHRGRTTRWSTPGSTRCRTSRRRCTSPGSGPRRSRSPAGSATGTSAPTPRRAVVRQFRDAGGGDKPAQGGFKACFAETEEDGVAIAHERWPNSALPGELSQVLPSPRHFEQATRWSRPSRSGQVRLRAGPRGSPGQDR